MIEVIEINIESQKEVKSEAWKNFLESFDFESDDRNFKYDFVHMTKKYGNAYIEHCRAAWAVNDGVMSDDEFCRINGNMPIGFFNSKIK